MRYEIGNKQNESFLSGIENIDKVKEPSSKRSKSEDDLDWLETAGNINPDTNYLEGIENLH